MKNPVDYSEYECPYSHLKKDCGHELKGPEGFQDTYGVWCQCGFRGPVFYLDPKDLKLERKEIKIVLLEEKIESVYEELHKKLNDHRNKAYITCEETCFCWDIEEVLRKYEEGGEKKLAKKKK